MGKLSGIKHLKRMEMTPDIEENLRKAFDNSSKMASEFKKKHKRQLNELLKDKTEY